MAAAYRQLAEQDNAGDLDRNEWLGLMLDRKAAIRADRQLTNRLAAAKLRFVETCIEDIDFASRRGLNRRKTLQLEGAWLKAHENLILTGQTPENLAGLRGGSCACLRILPWHVSTAASAPHRQTRPRAIAGARRLGQSYRQRSAAPRSPGIFEERYRRKSTLITAHPLVAPRDLAHR